MEARKQEDIECHDKLRTGAFEQRWSPEAEARVASDPMWSNFKYYAVEKESIDLREQWIRERAKGARVLDYCCGNGEEAIMVAKAGAASAVGIDLSEVSIENCRQLAAQAGVSDRVTYKAMDAEALEFPDNAFDLIIEYGVLHHLDLDKAMSELSRVLTPKGAFIGTETLSHNILIKRYRQRTPELRTAWEAEHILGHPQFQLIAKYFDRVDLVFFHLATLAAVPFRKSPLFPYILAPLRLIDTLLLKIPGLKWQAWQVLFIATGPRKAPGGR
jgi:ubiquinone/menaquinone biosynthesis C-methylase UbiE